MPVLPTVKVRNDAAPNGWMIINASDFVAGEHVRFEDAAEDAPQAPDTEASGDEPAASTNEAKPARGAKRK